MKRILYIVNIVVILALTAGGVSAQTTVSRSQADKLLEKVISGYTDWGRVELNGRGSTAALPVSASVKIYMEKGKKTMISARVPFVGEVARIEIDNDSMLIVNKMNKQYCKASVEPLRKIYPGLQKDLQTMLLGRVVIMGRGQLRAVDFDKVSVKETDDGSYVIVPEESLQPEGAAYGYVVTEDGDVDNMVIVIPDYKSAVEMDYSFEFKKDSTSPYSINITADVGDKSMEAELEFDSPKWGAQPMKPFEITDHYKETTIEKIF